MYGWQRKKIDLKISISEAHIEKRNAHKKHAYLIYRYENYKLTIRTYLSPIVIKAPEVFPSHRYY